MVPLVEIPLFITYTSVVETLSNSISSIDSSSSSNNSDSVIQIQQLLQDTAISTTTSTKDFKTEGGDDQDARTVKQEIVRRFRTEYRDSVMAGIIYNIPVTVINFTLIPPPLRVPFLDISECVWTCILSHLSHRSAVHHIHEQQEKNAHKSDNINNKDKQCPQSE